ncbi:hypothetical protein COUCH_01865 [Couchioplanes caeruleus]|uniref:hypothetical protein n=1 Tax=Couchioplanes caeruleus TaxID=56438 RepID=UPI0020C04382|nr:hypothetical protein [Couchioplanes caeruleus]UQU65124.1 hypothetical protein COUCH_01865 [Couchioplanes caeruleus]
MAASIGIWAQGDLAGERVLYRWEAGQDSGFVSFEVATRRFRPADVGGRPIGDLVLDVVSGDVTGAADGVGSRLLSQVAAAILRGYARVGGPPATAHAYYH